MRNNHSTQYTRGNVIPFRKVTGQKKVDIFPEYLSSHDENNLRRLIWMSASCFRTEKAATFAVWKSLRTLTRRPSPQKFLVSDIPALADEFERILFISSHFTETVRRMEKLVYKRLFREMGDFDEIMTTVEKELKEAAEENAPEREKRFAESLTDSFRNRRERFLHDYSDADEPQ